MKRTCISLRGLYSKYKALCELRNLKVESWEIAQRIGLHALQAPGPESGLSGSIDSPMPEISLYIVIEAHEQRVRYGPGGPRTATSPDLSIDLKDPPPSLMPISTSMVRVYIPRIHCHHLVMCYLSLCTIVLWYFFLIYFPLKCSQMYTFNERSMKEK